MTITEALMVALICITIVIVALACLFVLIRLFSFALELFSQKKVSSEAVPQSEAKETIPESEEDFSSGELKLKNVDERTAAMIMAIVSDESGIPLSELCFKSIKLIDKNS